MSSDLDVPNPFIAALSRTRWRASGIRVLDLTNVLAGPFCAYQLALLGADVIKVEVPGSGDLARQLGADPALSAQADGRLVPRPERAQEVDHARPQDEPAGKALFERLVAGADVVVENFRPGVMDRLGLGYDALSEAQPAARLLRHLRLRPGGADARRRRPTTRSSRACRA